MNQYDLKVIGSGEELTKSKNSNVPESQLHIFDYVTLDEVLVQRKEYARFTA